MALVPANRYEIHGKGVRGVIDGESTVSLAVDGRELTAATLTPTGQGLVIDAVVDRVFDRHSPEIQILLPQVNVDEEPVIFAGLATLTTSLTTVGGPRFVPGPVHVYESRPSLGRREWTGRSSNGVGGRSAPIRAS